MKFLDYYFLKKDLAVSAKEDPFQETAIQFLNTIIETLVALKQEVTPSTITRVLSSHIMIDKITKAVISEIGHKAVGKKWINMILANSDNRGFDYIKFYMVMCGIVRIISPKVEQFTDVKSKFFMGYQELDASPKYIDMGVNRSIIVHNNALCVSQNMVLEMLQDKLNNGLGFIYIDASNSEYSTNQFKNLIDLNGLNSNFESLSNFNFDIDQAIKNQKVIYIKFKKTKATAKALKSFTQELIHKISNISNTYPQYSVVTNHLDCLIRDEWVDLNKTLNNLTIEFNVIHTFDNWENLDQELINSANIKIICDDLNASKLNFIKHYYKSALIPDLLNRIKPHEYTYIDNESISKYTWTL